MKRVIFILLCHLMALTALAVDKDGDSIVICKPERVVISSNDSLQRIDVKGREGDSTYHYSKTVELPSNSVSEEESHKDWNIQIPFSKNREGTSAKPYWRLELGGFGFGWVVPLGKPSEMDLSSSFEAEIDKVLGVTYMKGKNGFSFGLGIRSKFFFMGSKHCFYRNGNRVDIGAYPANCNPKHSSITVGGLTFPLMYTRDFNKDFAFSIGPVLNWNFSGAMSSHFINSDGMTEDLSYRHIHQNPFTIDFKAQLYYKGFNFYVNYSPFKVFKNGYGPKFSCLSFGITI